MVLLDFTRLLRFRGSVKVDWLLLCFFFSLLVFLWNDKTKKTHAFHEGGSRSSYSRRLTIFYRVLLTRDLFLFVCARVWDQSISWLVHSVWSKQPISVAYVATRCDRMEWARLSTGLGFFFSFFFLFFFNLPGSFFYLFPFSCRYRVSEGSFPYFVFLFLFFFLVRFSPDDSLLFALDASHCFVFSFTELWFDLSFIFLFFFLISWNLLPRTAASQVSSQTYWSVQVLKWHSEGATALTSTLGPDWLLWHRYPFGTLTSPPDDDNWSVW